MNPPTTFAGFTPPTTAPTLGGIGGGAPTFLSPSGTTGFSFGMTKPATPATTGFSQPSATTASTGFNLGSTGFSSTTGFAPSSVASSAPSFTQTATSVATTGPTGFSLASSVTAAPSISSLTSTGTGFSLATSLSTPAVTALPASSAAATSAPTFSLGGGLGTVAPTTTTAAVAPAEGSGVGTKSSVNFAQLDDTIQKWTLELVELEKVFLNQMDQVRDWDRLLLSTGDKIVSLNDGMLKVKLRQKQLDNELDFIVSQQRELVECLIPLEKEFADVAVSDPERNSVYQRAENLNTQLQQVSEDLKGVIEHINERNKSQDTSDPIVQIGRILNAHMNSLQWVDQNTAVIHQMLDQVGKMKDIHRRDADSTQNL